MGSDRAEGIADRVRSSRFAREVIGPRVAAPVAHWLQTNFVDEAVDSEEGAEQGDTVGEGAAPADSGAAPATNPENAPAASDDGKDDGPDPEPDDEVVDGEASGAKQIAQQLKTRIKDDNLVVVAAGIAFWALLAIPAVLFATLSIAGLVLDPATVRDEVNTNLDGLPEEARTIIADQLENVSSGSTGGLITGLVLGILLALWTTSGAMAKMMSTLNVIYATTESRKFWVLRGTALLLTFGGIVFVSGAIFLLAVLPALLGEIDAVADSAAALFNWLRFPALAAVMIVALGVLYHIGPDTRSSYRPFNIGALVAAVLWIVLSGLFSIYTATAGSYNETYGSLGGLVILLLWLFITAFVVLIGAEIHALTARDPVHDRKP